MYHLNPDTKAAYAAARHRELLAEATHDRHVSLVQPVRPLAARLRAAGRWGTPVRVLRGGRPAAPPAVA